MRAFRDANTSIVTSLFVGAERWPCRWGVRLAAVEHAGDHLTNQLGDRKDKKPSRGPSVRNNAALTPRHFATTSIRACRSRATTPRSSRFRRGRGGGEACLGVRNEIKRLRPHRVIGCGVLRPRGLALVLRDAELSVNVWTERVEAMLGAGAQEVVNRDARSPCEPPGPARATARPIWPRRPDGWMLL